MIQAPTPDELQLWFRYEEIAMHFNELLMQYRLQLMAGFGALGTVASYLIGEKIDDDQRRNRIRFTVSVGMFVLLLAAAALDVFYYNRLLRGAVDELLAFEAAHPAIQMSTSIERVVGTGKFVVEAVYAALVIVFGAWVMGTCWYWISARRERPQIAHPPER